MSGKRERLFYDLVRLRLELDDQVRLRPGGGRLLSIANEKDLLSLALLKIGLPLDDARGALLTAAADAGALVESRERARVATFLQAQADAGGRVAPEDWRAATLLATLWRRAAGDPERAGEAVREIAAERGLRRGGGWSGAGWLPGPRRWWEATAERRALPVATKAAWRTVR